MHKVARGSASSAGSTPNALSGSTVSRLTSAGSLPASSRQVLNVPRTTLPAWRAWPETLNTYPHVGTFFVSGSGLAYLHRLIMALPVVFIEIGAGGIRLVCLFLHRRDSSGLGASYGTQQQVNHRVAEAMVADRQEESTRLAQDMPAPDITLTQDETFTGGLCLVGIEPARNSILLRAHHRGTRSRHLECINGRCPGASQVQCHPIDQ